MALAFINLFKISALQEKELIPLLAIDKVSHDFWRHKKSTYFRKCFLLLPPCRQAGSWARTQPILRKHPVDIFSEGLSWRAEL